MSIYVGVVMRGLYEGDYDVEFIWVVVEVEMLLGIVFLIVSEIVFVWYYSFVGFCECC